MKPVTSRSLAALLALVVAASWVGAPAAAAETRNNLLLITVDTLRAALADQSSATRVRAAVALLSALPAIVEHVELSSRITELEARIEGNEQWHAGN